MACLPVTKLLSGNLRSETGSQMAELPPALIILFVLVLPPLINLFWVFAGYIAGWYLNQTEARSIAAYAPPGLTQIKTTNAQGQSVITYAPTTIQDVYPPNSNWNGFFYLGANPPSVTYNPVNSNGPLVGTATVTTVTWIEPFFKFSAIPFLSQIPGLGKPMYFTFKDTILQEEQTSTSSYTLNLPP